jgi:hypothetical protein
LFFISASPKQKTGAEEFPWPVEIVVFRRLDSLIRGDVPGVDQAGMGEPILKNKPRGRSAPVVKGFKLFVKSNLNLQGSPCGFVLYLNKHRSLIKQKTILSLIRTCRIYHKNQWW